MKSAYHKEGAPDKGPKLPKEPGPVKKILQSIPANVITALLIPAIIIVTMEWVARGTLADNKQGNGFFQALDAHFPSFLIAYLLLLFVYVFVLQFVRRHTLPTIVTGLLGYVPSLVTYYKLTMRGEPFLPWDLSQISDLASIQSNVEFSIPSNVFIVAGVFVLMIAGASFIKLPFPRRTRPGLFIRLSWAGGSMACILVLLFGVFLSPSGTAALHIREDMWMQDRYYRTNGVITGFLTNLQMLNIEKPEGYSAEAVQAIAEETEAKAQDAEPYYENSPVLSGEPAQQPDIIYLMAESFWDVTSLEGIAYDRELLPNLTRLSEEGARGMAYTPSFGGGTCDVEFEALTGYSVEYLPSGSKPYQQYVTDDMFSLPNYLKSDGYQTLAIHGYGRKFWNRDVAYPRLGLDIFIAEDDFVDPERRRGFISDNAMVDRIIEEYENRQDPDAPVFIHAITMQNHTTYDPGRYPEDELVDVVSYPDTISESTIGQLRDCATGIYEMDAALGKLTDYLADSDRPTILVFWGDHLNPMSDGYSLFEETGFIEDGDTGSPALHQTPLLIWSNFSNEAVDLGVVGTYNISPIMMDLYGIEKPVLFEYLTGQLDVLHARSHGVTVNPDGSTSLEMTPEQQEAFDTQGILQYDYLFGDQTLPSYVVGENST